jgi:hypothetical protein
MADSASLRSRRSRAHAQGDHYLCRAGCGGRSAVATVLADTDAPLDPHASLEGLARRLEAAHEADPANALLAKALLAVLLVLSAPEDDLGFDVG